MVREGTLRIRSWGGHLGVEIELGHAMQARVSSSRYRAYTGGVKGPSQFVFLNTMRLKHRPGASQRWA